MPALPSFLALLAATPVGMLLAGLAPSPRFLIHCRRVDEAGLACLLGLAACTACLVWAPGLTAAKLCFLAAILAGWTCIWLSKADRHGPGVVRAPREDGGEEGRGRDDGPDEDPTPPAPPSGPDMWVDWDKFMDDLADYQTDRQRDRELVVA